MRPGMKASPTVRTRRTGLACARMVIIPQENGYAARSRTAD